MWIAEREAGAGCQRDALCRQRRVAATALRTIGPPAVDALLAATGNANARIRQWSATVLGEIGEKRAAEILGDLAANDPDGEVRDAARRALRDLRSPR